MPQTNPDYTPSAVNLKNPKSIEVLLKALKKAEIDLAKARAAIALTPQQITLDACEDTVAGLRQTIADTIDNEGSYQDIDLGAYAIKQRKLSMVYSVALVRSRLPELASDIIKIEESVDKKVIESLIKDGFTTQEAVNQCGRPRESFAFIIDTGDIEVFDIPASTEVGDVNNGD